MLGNPINQLDPGDYVTTITDANACVKQMGPFEVNELTGSLTTQMKFNNLSVLPIQ